MDFLKDLSEFGGGGMGEIFILIFYQVQSPGVANPGCQP